MESQKQLWEKVLGEIEVQVSKANFVTLLKKTTLISLEKNAATISAPNTMLINMIQKRFGEMIKKALDKQTGFPTTLNFVTKQIEKTDKVAREVGPLFIKENKPSIVGHLSRVRSDFIFSTLAVSDSNRLAFESAKVVAKDPGKSYNPLFIYGPVGVGKTHLMQAIANDVYQKNPENKIIYLTSEEFTNEVVEAIRFNDTAKMKRKFRSVHLFLVDDVQFIAGKEKVQEELFHTFNTLIDTGAQIVLSSDRPPSEIKKLEKRLSSRFAGGLTVDVSSPDFELRTAILLKKAEKLGFNLDIEVAKEIAQKEQDVRSLEGLLLKIITQAKSNNEAITASFTRKALEQDKKIKTIIYPDDVLNRTCDIYRVKPTQLRGPKRDASLVKPRQIIMYLLKKELGLSLVEIGNFLGGRDHTTIMHGVRKTEQLMLDNPNFLEEIMGITKTLRG